VTQVTAKRIIVYRMKIPSIRSGDIRLINNECKNNKKNGAEKIPVRINIHGKLD
jgi:hypothetical protein